MGTANFTGILLNHFFLTSKFSIPLSKGRFTKEALNLGKLVNFLLILYFINRNKV
jgi:hypothetical protein